MADIYIFDVLRKASNVYSQAKANGVPVPKFIDPSFRNQLYSVYREPLVNAGIDLEALGHLLGNKARWDVQLCRSVTLSFMEFFVSRFPNLKGFNSQVLLESAYGRVAFEEVHLPSLQNLTITEGVLASTPKLFLNKPRTFSIQAKVQFPNIKKSNERGMEDLTLYKWLKLKYRKNSEGQVSIVKFPKFRAIRNTTTGTFSARGQIEAMPGEVLQYTYCEISADIKAFCIACLHMIASRDIDYVEISKLSRLIDFINIMLNQNEKFVVKRNPSFEQGDLFGIDERLVTLPLFDAGGSNSKVSARINGEDDLENIYVVFGEPSKLEALLDGRLQDIPVLRADLFKPHHTNIFECYLGDTEIEEPEILIVMSKVPLPQLSEKVALLRSSEVLVDYDKLKVSEFSTLSL